MIKKVARIDLNGKYGSIELDGKQVPNVRGFELSAEAGHPPLLTLDVRLETTLVDGEMCVTVPAKTYDALVQLGWTPPPVAEQGR